MVENQKVYNVTVYADSTNSIMDEAFLNCVYGMAKAINPDLTESVLVESVDNAIAAPDKKIINEDTLFRCDSEDLGVTISY